MWYVNVIINEISTLVNPCVTSCAKGCEISFYSCYYKFNNTTNTATEKLNEHIYLMDHGDKLVPAQKPAQNSRTGIYEGRRGFTITVLNGNQDQIQAVSNETILDIDNFNP